MSTLAEHIAAIEFYRANYDERQSIKDALHMELWLLASAHMKEIATLCSPVALTDARLSFAEKMRANYGDAADPFICRWFAAPRSDTPPEPQPEAHSSQAQGELSVNAEGTPDSSWRDEQTPASVLSVLPILLQERDREQP